MPKFNKQNTITRQMSEHPDAVLNKEGGLSFTTDPLTELYMRAATCLVGEPKFYESAQFADQELISAARRALTADPKFVLQLAVYCREQMHLRSVPLVLCAEYANIAPGTVDNARQYISRVIQRPDELSELIAYQFKRNAVSSRKTKLPMAIKAGIAGAFPKFDTYQLGKYRGDNSAVSLKDALFMTHPKAKNPEQQKDWDNLVYGTLETPVTWETQRSQGLKNWSEVIHSVFNKDGKINNYMAQIRNLRNIMKSPDVSDEDIALVCTMLSDFVAVKNSKQLPFRYLTAYRTIRYGMWTERRGNEIIMHEGDTDITEHPMINSVLDAIEKAAAISVNNMPMLPGKTLIACDVSGSMFKQISEKSVVQNFDIGLMLGSMAHQFCNISITGIFGDIWETIPMSKQSGILSNVIDMRGHEGEVGYSTYGHKVIEYLLKNGIRIDRILIFTDNQMWNSASDIQFAPAFIKYQRKVPGVRLYSFDLAGYGTIEVPQDTKNVSLIAGWSDRIFDYIRMNEMKGDNQLDAIRSIRI